MGWLLPLTMFAAPNVTDRPDWREIGLREMALRHAAALRRLEADLAAGRRLPQPARITMALDAQGLYGPDVDRACLAAEPDVDRWEAGESAPSWEQLIALADLTGMHVEFFFREVEAAAAAAWWFCRRSGRGKGCEQYLPSPPVAPYEPPADVIPIRR